MVSSLLGLQTCAVIHKNRAHNVSVTRHIQHKQHITKDVYFDRAVPTSSKTSPWTSCCQTLCITSICHRLHSHVKIIISSLSSHPSLHCHIEPEGFWLHPLNVEVVLNCFWEAQREREMNGRAPHSQTRISFPPSAGCQESEAWESCRVRSERGDGSAI